MLSGLVAVFSFLLLIAGTDGVMASNSGGDVPETTDNFSVKLEVRSSLGVSVDGVVSSDAKAIRIGDPATGMVSYVILDG